MADKITELNNNKIIRLRDLLGEISKEGFSVLSKFDSKDKFMSIEVYVEYFQRFTYTLNSTLALLKDFENNQQHEYSIAIILRASLLDSLTIHYLMSYYREQNKKSSIETPNYNSELKKLLSSQIRRSFKALKANKYFNQKKYKEYVDIISDRYKYLFNETTINYNSPEKSLIFSKDEITNKIIKNRLDLIDTESRINHNDIFSLYDIYSKYDHFGIMSMLFQKLDINEKIQNILWSLFYIVDGIEFSLELIKNEENIDKEYKKLIHLCGVLRGVVVTDYLELGNSYRNEHK